MHVVQRRGWKDGVKDLPMPLKISVTAIWMARPRGEFGGSLKTLSQNMAPSVFSIQVSNMSRVSSGNTCGTKYMALLHATPSSRVSRTLH